VRFDGVLYGIPAFNGQVRQHERNNRSRGFLWGQNVVHQDAFPVFYFFKFQLRESALAARVAGPRRFGGGGASPANRLAPHETTSSSRTPARRAGRT
jgi:hypothetical protein